VNEDAAIDALEDLADVVLNLSPSGTDQVDIIDGGVDVNEDGSVDVDGTGNGPEGAAKNVVAHYRTDSSGNYQGTLPTGNYTVQAHLDGHMPASPDPASVTLTASMTTDQDFTIPDAGRLDVNIVDENNAPIAAKVSIVGIDPYPDPGNSQTFLGLIENRTHLFTDFSSDSFPFGLADVRFVDDSGDSGEFYIEPRPEALDYRVVVSHGPEYSVYTADVDITAGALTTVNAQIARVVDTTGFVSGDFHIHQLDSPDSEVTNESRVITALAEGVDFFTPSDHEHRTDLSSLVSSMGVGGKVSVAVNNENTSPDYGHFNAWPLTTDPSLPNNGALDWGSGGGTVPPAGDDFPSKGWYHMPPSEIIANLLADLGTDTVQINHTDSFFGPEGLAVDTSYIPPQDFADNLDKRLDPAITNLFDSSFTALESWQGTDRNDILNRFIGRNMGDWFNLLDQGIIRPSVADSDTHKRIVNAAGFPRTFLASSTEDAGLLDDSQATLEGLATNVNNGRAIGTNGPFIRVTASTPSAGNTGGLSLDRQPLISTADGTATINVAIQSPLWAEFDRVEFYVNDVPTPNYYDNNVTTPPFWTITPHTVVNVTPTPVDITPVLPGDDRLEASAKLNLTGLTNDTWVVVLVRGTDGTSKPLFPVIPNDLKQSTNGTLADLTDGNLGEDAVPAVAFSNPLFISLTNDGDYDTHPVDNDRDGCTNDRELGTNVNMGGGRSPSNFWDFFDVPTPPSFLRDRAVTIGDIAAVIARFGSNVTPPSKANAYTQALSAPPPPPAYHAGYDRTPGVGQGRTGPPNGSITIQDITMAVLQFGHNCT